jgi:hypothetical protein
VLIKPRRYEQLINHLTDTSAAAVDVDVAAATSHADHSAAAGNVLSALLLGRCLLHLLYSICRLTDHTISPPLLLLLLLPHNLQITQLQQALCSAHPCWVAACHNDLQYGNIMAPAPAAAAAAGSADASGSAAAPAGDDAAAAELSQQLGNLGINAKEGYAAGAAAVGHTVATAAALQQHHEHHKSTSSSSTAHGTPAYNAAAAAAAAAAAGPAAAGSSGLVRGHSMDSLPSEVTDFSGVALAGSSPTPSVASLPAKMHESGSATSLNLTGRSPANMQLPDGSLVLPGMKARPRGQSPDRGKRPDSFSNALGAPGFEGLGMHTSSSGRVVVAAAGDIHSKDAAGDVLGSAASFGSQAELAAAAGAAALQPPSAAAVLRHSSSAGELFVSAGIPGESSCGM